MRASLGTLSILLAGVIAGYLYRMELRAPGDGASVAAQVDMVGLRNDLRALAQAERRYLAANGRYATLDELRHSPELFAIGTARRGYRYGLEITESGFRITARPAGAEGGAGPVLAIDETMRISIEPPDL